MAWEDLDADDEQALAAAERTPFRTVLIPGADRELRAGSTPAPVVWLGIAVIVGVIVLAVVLYRLAPP